MKRVLVVTAVALAAVAVTVSPVSAATGNATSGCVTKAEYKRVHKGATLAKVAQTFGTPGKRMSIATSGGYGAQVRNYPTCSPYSAVAIAFDKNPGGLYRLSAKSALWVA